MSRRHARRREFEREVEHVAAEVAAVLDPKAAESRVPVVIAVVAAAVLQTILPDRLALTPRWPLLLAEGALLVALTYINPLRLENERRVARWGSLALTAIVTAANAFSAVRLEHAILSGTAHNDASALLGSGAAIYVTNIVAFGLWYWEFDRGGPFARHPLRPARPPDFLFPQQSTPDVAPPGWRPLFVDYLYVSFTNAFAFSPTDTMPLSRWAKLLMLTQSAIALSVVALVVARAVNVLA